MCLKCTQHTHKHTYSRRFHLNNVRHTESHFPKVVLVSVMAKCPGRMGCTDDIAETYFALAQQSPLGWSNEIDIRPFQARFCAVVGTTEHPMYQNMNNEFPHREYFVHGGVNISGTGPGFDP